MRVTVYGTKSGVVAIAVEGSRSYAAPDQASHTQYASPIRACNYRGRRIGVDSDRIRIAGFRWWHELNSLVLRAHNVDTGALHAPVRPLLTESAVRTQPVPLAIVVELRRPHNP